MEAQAEESTAERNLVQNSQGAVAQRRGHERGAIPLADFLAWGSSKRRETISPDDR
jgi:hypothetical protein